MTAAAAIAGYLLALAAAPPPGVRPGWLDLSRLQRVTPTPVPTLDGARRSTLEKERHPYVEGLRQTDYELRPDGTVEERTTFVRHFLSEDGIRQGGTVSVFARTSSDRVALDEAYALGPEGQRTPFDPKLLQVMTGGRRDLFSDTQEVALPFPGLKVGSTLVLVYRRTRDPRRWPLPWSEVVHVQGFAPIERFQLSVRWPAGRRRPVWQTSDGALACDAGPDQVRCTRKQIPAVLPDPEVASWPDLLPHIVVTGGESWEDLIRLERKLLDGGVADARTRGTAERLIRGATSEQDRLERLFRFVADEIRYVGFEHGHGAVVPRPPAVTLERRFGDCKDKVVLFLAMARAVGIDAYPVLMATDHQLPERMLLPSWKYFDHVVVCARPGKGRPVCLDPTDPDLPAGVVSFGIRAAVALPLLPGGRPAHLPREPDTDRYGWDIRIEVLNEVACNGTIAETVTRTYRGAGAGVMRGRLRAQNTTDRTRWLEQSYAYVMGETVKPTVDVQGLEDRRAPLVLKTVASYPGKSPVHTWPELAEPDSWIASIGKEFRTDNRHHPHNTSGLKLQVRTSYQICSTVRPQFLGPLLDLRAGYGSLHRTYRASASGVVADTMLLLEPQTVGAGQLASFNRFIDTILGQTRLWFSLAPGGSPGQ
jgi:transglutaminase-like putative cysteine protease